MSNFIEDINRELKELCSDYLDILRHLKNKEIIDQKTYDECANNKIIFLEE